MHPRENQPQAVQALGNLFSKALYCTDFNLSLILTPSSLAMSIQLRSALEEQHNLFYVLSHIDIYMIHRSVVVLDVWYLVVVSAYLYKNSWAALASLPIVLGWMLFQL